MGLIAFTKTLAVEGAKYGIKATAIAPVRSATVAHVLLRLSVPADSSITYDGNYHASGDAR